MKPRKLLQRGAGWVLVIRDSASEQEANAYGAVHDSRAIHALLAPRMREEVCEVFYVLHLNAANRVIGITEAARGTVSGLHVSAPDVFRAACAQGARAVILAHNHPSGDPTPSIEDERFTSVIVEAGRVLGIQVLDHVVIAGDRYRSFCDDGKLS
jgi:DNA repair protein RadC